MRSSWNVRYIEAIRRSNLRGCQSLITILSTDLSTWLATIQKSNVLMILNCATCQTKAQAIIYLVQIDALRKIYDSSLAAQLQWRHNEHHQITGVIISVSNHRRLFRRRSKKNIKALRHKPLWGEWPSNAENVSIRRRHHAKALTRWCAHRKLCILLCIFCSLRWILLKIVWKIIEGCYKIKEKSALFKMTDWCWTGVIYSNNNDHDISYNNAEQHLITPSEVSGHLRINHIILFHIKHGISATYNLRVRHPKR